MLRDNRINEQVASKLIGKLEIVYEYLYIIFGGIVTSLSMK